MSIVYAGIGSRSTPIEILKLMAKIGHKLALEGATLRSGAADGADMAFEHGCNQAHGKKEIYAPWFGYQSRTDTTIVRSAQAEEIAKFYHPNWNACSKGVKKLHIRCVYQILGKDLDKPADFVICWTPNGFISGGTGQAIRIAIGNKVPVYNLGSKRVLEKVLSKYS